MNTLRVNSEQKTNYFGAPIKSPVSDQSEMEGTKNQELLSFLSSIYKKSQESRSRFDKNWKKYKKYYDGDQWEVKPPAFKSAPNINIIRSAIETILPLLTDTSPGFNTIAKNPQDWEFSQTISKCVQDWWSREAMDLVLTEAIKDSLKSDYGCIKVVWDEEKENGLGEVSCKIVDPENIWVNKGATSFLDAEYVIERYYKTTGEIRRLFPETSKGIGPTTNPDRDEQNAKEKTLSGEVELVSPIDQKSTISRKAGSNDQTSDYDEVELFEFYFRDYTLEDFTDDEGKELQKLKYNKLRLVTVCLQKKIILQDTTIPYKDNKFPYVRIVDNIRSREFCGQGEVEPLIETQDLINKVWSGIVDHLNIVMNSTWIVDDDSGVEPDMLTNQVGLIVVKKRGTEVRRDPPPPMPQQYFELYSMLQALADQQSGVNDVTQGRKPVGITAAEALQTMQEAAQTRIRLKERNLTTSLVNLGYLVIARMMQYYTTPRVVRITGKDVKFPDYFEFNIEPVNEEKYILNKQDYSFNPERQKYEVVKPMQPVGPPTKGIFSVEVVGGSSLPFLKEKRSNLALKLYELGVIDDEELLTQLDWQRKEEILRRVEEKKQQAAMQQQQQQQQQAQPEPQ